MESYFESFSVGRTFSTASTTATYSQSTYNSVPPLDVDLVLSDIKALRAKVDVLIVSLHWGQEYSDKPTQQQILIAHKLVDGGADIILGHHPHVIQGIEKYKGKIIAYSLGNFIFDQVETKTSQSVMLEIQIEGDRVQSTRVIPIILDRYIPRLADGDEAREIMGRIQLLSNRLNEASGNPIFKINF